MNCTTIEQSKKLIELGLSPETADMKWYYWKDEIDAPKVPTLGFDKRVSEYYKNTQAIYLPCWSFEALLKLMPKTISVPVDERSAYLYNLEWQFANDNSLRYIATNRSKCLIDIYSDHDIGSKSFIETAFEMIVWLLENGYIKSENK